MSTYVIGDIQGCYQSFQKLLNKIKFNPVYDQLYLAGDLVNRGPDSLATMLYILEHKSSIKCVLGNHDLHFLAVAHYCQPAHHKDTFHDILDSTYRDRIVRWLSQQPLAIHLQPFNSLIVHAGLPYFWSAKQAISYSNEVSQVLQSSSRYQYYVSMYGNRPNQWSNELAGVDRLRYITNAFTRMRFCRHDGSLELKTKCAVGRQPEHLLPWYQIANQHYQGNVIFGHWAALQGRVNQDKRHAIDTGCVWGAKLTALRLEDYRRISVNSAEE